MCYSHHSESFMKIIENVFPLEQADYIEDLLTSLCSWSYLPDSSGNIKDGRKFPSFSKPIYGNVLVEQRIMSFFFGLNRFL